MGATFSTLCKNCVGSLCPLLTSTEKMQETGPMVYHPYLRRLGFLSICGCHSKDSRFFSVISRPWMLRSRVWTVNLPHTVQHSTTWATQSVVSSGSSFQAQFLMQMFIPIYHKQQIKEKKIAACYMTADYRVQDYHHNTFCHQDFLSISNGNQDCNILEC